MLIPYTVSTKDIQRNYRRVFNKVKITKEPIVVMTNNNPDVVIIAPQELESLYERARIGETLEAFKAISVYRKEKAAKKLRKLRSLRDLM